MSLMINHREKNTFLHYHQIKLKLQVNPLENEKP